MSQCQSDGTLSGFGNWGAGLGKFIYDGLGRKIRAIYDTTGPEDVHDGEIGIGDVEEIYLHDLNWRVISIFRKEFGTTESEPACYQQIVYHERGNTDRPIMRRRDADGGVAGDGVLEENLYYLTNHRGDVVMLVDGSSGEGGLVKDRVRYSAYGVPELQSPPGDFNRDGEIDSQDYADFVSAILAEDPAADHNHDGVLDEADGEAFLEDFYANGVAGATGEGPYQADVGGSGKVRSGVGLQSNFDNRTGYAGYWWDPFVGLYHVRHRVYDPWQGRWLTRDPIGYSGGMNLYEYCGGDPIGRVDPMGLLPPDGLAMDRFIMTMTGQSELQEDLEKIYHMPVTPSQATAVLVATASTVPGVGEAMDVHTIAAKDSAWWERGLAAVSLAVSMVSVGFAPNYGAIRVAGEIVEEGAETAAKGAKAAEAAKAVQAAADAAGDVKRVKITIEGKPIKGGKAAQRDGQGWRRSGWHQEKQRKYRDKW